MCVGRGGGGARACVCISFLSLCLMYNIAITFDMIKGMNVFHMNEYHYVQLVFTAFFAMAS